MKYNYRTATGKFQDILKIHEKVFLFCESTKWKC